MSIFKAGNIVLASLLPSLFWTVTKQKAVPSYLAVADYL